MFSNITKDNFTITPQSDYRSEEAGGLRDKVQALISEVTTLKIQLSSTEKWVQILYHGIVVGKILANQS